MTTNGAARDLERQGSRHIPETEWEANPHAKQGARQQVDKDSARDSKGLQIDVHTSVATNDMPPV